MLVVNGLAECGDLVGGENTTAVACEPCWRLDVNGLHVVRYVDCFPVLFVNSTKCLCDFDIRAAVCFMSAVFTVGVLLCLYLCIIWCWYSGTLDTLFSAIQDTTAVDIPYFFLGCLYHEFLLT